MPIDLQLLKKAEQQGALLAEAERQAQLARADYHTAVRRLHLGGASLREIAQALRVSHQRVQQIVDGAGGTWWQRVWRSRAVGRDAVCTFCGRPPSEVAKLIAGPNVYICDACVARAEESATRPHGSDDRARRCSFCGKRQAPAGSRGLGPPVHICQDCLRLCRQILDDRAA